MAEAAVLERTETTALVPLQTKLPEAGEARGITPEAWHVLKTTLYRGSSDEMICTVIDYCKARGLDPIKKPFHIVTTWDAKEKREIESIWPSIGETRITAMRTGEYAGLSDIEHGPLRTAKVGKTDITFPEWAQCSVYRIIQGQKCEFSGPKVYWLEEYAQKGADPTPNRMWARRPYGQLNKCAEAAALRAAFPEENSIPTAEEMAGQTINGHAEDITLTAPAKDGNAGLKQFGESSNDQNIIDAHSVEVTEVVTSDGEVVQQPTKAEPADTRILFWVSPDEPERELDSLSEVPRVLQDALKKAPTLAMANLIAQHNAGLVSQVDNVNRHTKFSQKIESILNDRAAADGNGGGTGKLL